MNIRSIRIIGVLLVGMILFGCTVPRDQKDPRFSAIIAPSLCSSAQEYIHIEGSSMEPMIKNGTQMILLRGYYQCTTKNPERNDLVAGIFEEGNLPFIKKIVATPDDRVSIQNNTLIINGKTLQNSASKEYILSPQEQAILSQSIQHNRIPQNTYIVFGDSLHHSLDSRKFGAIPKDKILGKVIFQSQKEQY